MSKKKTERTPESNRKPGSKVMEQPENKDLIEKIRSKTKVRSVEISEQEAASKTVLLDLFDRVSMTKIVGDMQRATADTPENEERVQKLYRQIRNILLHRTVQDLMFVSGRRVDKKEIAKALTIWNGSISEEVMKAYALEAERLYDMMVNGEDTTAFIESLDHDPASFPEERIHEVAGPDYDIQWSERRGTKRLLEIYRKVKKFIKEPLERGDEAERPYRFSRKEMIDKAAMNLTIISHDCEAGTEELFPYIAVTLFKTFHENPFQWLDDEKVENISRMVAEKKIPYQKVRAHLQGVGGNPEEG